MESVGKLPGEELVRRGIRDLEVGVESREALLVSIGAPRLRRLGYAVPEALSSPELRLCELLQTDHGDAAHARYNALVRRLVSFERAVGTTRRPVREVADEERIVRFMRAVGVAAREGDCYLTGGATAVLAHAGSRRRARGGRTRARRARAASFVLRGDRARAVPIPGCRRRRLSCECRGCAKVVEPGLNK